MKGLVTSVALTLGLVLHVALARAETSNKELYIASAASLAIPIGLDMLLWALAAPPPCEGCAHETRRVHTRDHSLAWHLVPLAGPVVGIREVARRECTDPIHGCAMVDGMTYIYSGLFFAAQTAGVVLALVATFRDDPTTARAASALRPPLSVQPTDGGFLISTGFSWK